MYSIESSIMLKYIIWQNKTHYHTAIMDNFLIHTVNHKKLLQIDKSQVRYLCIWYAVSADL